MDTFASEFADDHARQMAEEDFPGPVSDRGWAVADELAEALGDLVSLPQVPLAAGPMASRNAEAALRRYEEARNG